MLFITRRILWAIAAAAAIACLIFILIVYQRVFSPNVNLEDRTFIYFYVPTGAGFDSILTLLEEQGIIEDPESFRWLSYRKNYHNHVHSGRYRIENGMSNNKLINLLRSGNQEPVDLTFNHVRSRGELSSVVAGQIEPDSASIYRAITSDSLASLYGFTGMNFYAVFIPNTYEVYWDISTNALLQRMVSEYDFFWKGERERLAREMGMTRMQVMILASIVDEETYITEEEPVIAGVYINRLRKGMRLQADPTIKYAVGDMDMKRILKKHLEIDSPFNTYRRAGLPPAPIVIPSISAIDAVLHHENHDYLYFCAKGDFSGRHDFSKTLAQHNRNARLYQKALDRRKILN